MAYQDDEFIPDNATADRGDNAKQGIVNEKVRLGDDVFLTDDEVMQTRKPEGEVVDISKMTIPDCDSTTSAGSFENDLPDENRSVYMVVVAVVVALAVVWFTSMLTPLVRNVCESAGWGRVVAVVWLLIPLGAIGYAAIRAWRVFRNLSPSLKLKASEFRGRETDKGSVINLKDRLQHKYVAHFHCSGKCKNDIGDKAFDKLIALKNDKQVLPDDWVADFREFQEALKEKADEIIDACAVKIGMATAISRNKKIDIVITLYLSAKMMMDIACLFKHRMTKFGAAKTACMWAFNFWTAGQLQAKSEKLVKWIGKIAYWASVGIATKMGSTPVGIMIGKASDKVIQGVGGVTAEAAVNYLLARRLGDKAVQEFTPVEFE